MPSDTPTFSQWRARPVFISSTFKDMQAERSYLQSHVFPRLEEKLRERRHQLEPIDLRLGVETAELRTEEARELLVLKVCLEEIQRSRPFLIVILGDRYGWVPPPERMETATQEAGFQTEVKGKSVTALEIEFGVLKEHPDQRQRSFFYFREPLPYDQMPSDIAAQYSDAHSPDASVRAGHERLQELKRQISGDPEFEARVHSYHATWDAVAQRVTGLQEWGDAVFEHLWAVLDEETRDFASQPPETWEQRERAALTEFVAQRSRDFTGRTDLLAQLHDIATSPFHAADPLNAAALNTGITWGACVTGVPGSGKSAVLAELYQRLAKDDSILILANAAGATPRGTEPDAMLRRFIGELAAVLGIADPLPENAGPDDVDATFASLLARTAQQTRVVVLLDALDQFDATPRGQHLTWLRARQWPGNARLIATGITGTAPVEAFSKWAGVDELDLPSLASPDVSEIARRVWARYHRQVNPDVLRVLAEKKLPDGTAAAGNPLWLTLALEQVNLLDADDFARAEREFTGSPAERLRALLVDTATRMPPDVPALYGWLLEQTEKTFGVAHARAFGVLIALGRFGWRESDLLNLVPIVAELLFPSADSSFSDLSLASIRRGFRAHLARRGAVSQLDFFHAQMRQAVQSHALRDAALVRTIHRAIADHLETLPETDPLRESELMVHLIGSDDKERAAQVLADLPLPSTGLTGAIQAFVRHIALGVAQHTHDHLIWVTQLPTQLTLSEAQVAKTANRFNFDLHDALAATSSLSTLLAIINSARLALERLTASNPANAAWQRDLSVSLIKLGELAVAQGDLAGAFRSFSEAKTIRQRLAASEPANTMWQRDLCASVSKLGDLAVAQGDLAGGRRRFTQSKTIAERLAASDPANTACQRDLAVTLVKLGALAVAQGDLAGALRSFAEAKSIAERLAASDPANAAWQRDLSVSLIKLGELAVAQGDLAGALRFFSQAKSIAERLAASDPANTACQRDLAVSHVGLGDLAVAQGDLAGALRSFIQSKSIAERLAASDPANAAWQFDLGISNDRLGDLAVQQGRLDEASVFHTRRKDIISDLAAKEPANAEWQSDLAVSLNKLGELAVAQGDLAGALRSFAEAKSITERLAASDPANAAWQRDLSVSLNKLGELAVAHGDLAGALRSFSAAKSIRQSLATSDPTNTAWQRDLSVSLIKLGDIAVAQGDLAGALRSFSAAKSIRQSLATSDPTNTEWQFALGISNDRLGDLAVQQGRLDEASGFHTRRKDIISDLAAKEPANAEWQSDLAVSLNKLGELAVAQGDLAGALRSFAEAKSITERLAASDPANAAWQFDLGISNERLGDLAVQQGKLDDASVFYTSRQDIISDLAANDPTNTAWQRDLSVSLNKLGELALAQGDLAGALRSFSEGKSIAERLAASDLANAAWQRDLAASHFKLCELALKQGNEAMANAELKECYTVLDGIKQRGLHFDPQMAQVYEQLRGIDFEHMEPSQSQRPMASPATAPVPPSVQELLRMGDASHRRGQWEGAETFYTKALALGEPLEGIAAKLVDCLLNAHAELSPTTQAKITGILDRLRHTGDGELAAKLQADYEARLPKPTKSKWKFWG